MSLARFFNTRTALLTCFLMVSMVIGFSSCEGGDPLLVVKDYGLKTFSADYKYDIAASGDEVSYKNQVYFSFADTTAVATGIYGTDSWTDFNLIAESSGYNSSSDVDGWDLVFTNYTTIATYQGISMPYKVTGVLINADAGIEVALITYTGNQNSDSIASAFANLTLSDAEGLTYSGTVDAIGYEWKSINLSTYTYTVHTNYFYIVKLDSETYYKTRFLSFYGSSTSERIATIQFQFMQ